MAELTPKERLQPSLLDRLTDLDPQRSQESRQHRVLSFTKLRTAVLRDLEWLLNSGKLSDLQNLDEYPLVKHSVLNYGMPDLAGNTASSMDVHTLEKILRQVIMDYEPRILRNSIKVHAVVAADKMNLNALTFEIEGELWAQPTPERMFLKTQVDLENGDIKVMEHA